MRSVTRNAASHSLQHDTFSHKGRKEGSRPTLPRRLHRAILRLLRPAESAVRRLIIIAARGIIVPPSPPRLHKPRPPSIFLRKRNGTGIVLPRGTLPNAQRPAPRAISLPLLDLLKRPFRRQHRTPICEPRISHASPFATLSPVKLRRSPEPDDPLDATRLMLRLQALAAALDDLPKQGRRLARWRTNSSRDRKAGKAVRKSNRRLSPLRPGPPPGSRRKPDHEIDELLTDLHGLAFDVLNDTS